MRKFLCLIAAISIVATLGAFAGMDDWDYVTKSLIGAKAATNAKVIRGEIECVKVWSVTPLSGETGTVVITSNESTLFSAEVTNNKVAYPRIQVTDNGGTGLSFLMGTNSIPGQTTNAWYGKYPVAGVVTSIVTQTGLNTNTYRVKIIFKK